MSKLLYTQSTLQNLILKEAIMINLAFLASVGCWSPNPAPVEARPWRSS